MQGLKSNSEEPRMALGKVLRGSADQQTPNYELSIVLSKCYQECHKLVGTRACNAINDEDVFVVITLKTNEVTYAPKTPISTPIRKKNVLRTALCA